MFDTVIRGGTAMVEGQAIEADIAIQGEQIAAIVARGADLPARQVVDAGGKLVLPGGVDPHFHIRCFNAIAEDFAAATRAAAFGGYTTLGIFVRGRPFSGSGVSEFLDHFLEEGDRTSHVDFMFHCNLQGGQKDQVGEAFNRGIRSVKLMMAYLARGLQIPDDEMVEVMKQVKAHQGITMVHAENGYLIDRLENKMRDEGKRTWEYFSQSRPILAEQEAIHRAIYYSDLTGCPLYVVHLTTKEGLALITEAQAQGKPIFTETCPQYLTLTNDDMGKQGGQAKVGPPLRSQEDNEALWGGIRDGVIKCIGSDHAAFTLEQKTKTEFDRKDIEDFFHVVFGMPVSEVMMPLTYSEGVVKGRISLEQWVACVTENPARQFGVYPKKGVLRVGSDADICIFDPNLKWTIKASELHSVDYNCWEGWAIQGKPVATFLRGHALLSDNELKASPGIGQYLSRGPLTFPGFSR